MISFAMAASEILPLLQSCSSLPLAVPLSKTGVSIHPSFLPSRRAEALRSELQKELIVFISKQCTAHYTIAKPTY